MTPAADKRSELIDKLADHILADGLLNASLRPLAKAVGTSDRMLLYYFKDKDALIEAVLDRIADRITAILEQSAAPEPLPLEILAPFLIESMKSEIFWPYLRLWLEVAALSAGGDPLYKACGERIGRGFVAWGAQQLAAPHEGGRRTDAAKLLIQIEGSVLLRSLGLDDVVDRAFTPSDSAQT
ncbi:MAG: TetR/AcrR family transcriptional regulator [Pseudomonadota bacterium]